MESTISAEKFINIFFDLISEQTFLLVLFGWLRSSLEMLTERLVEKVSTPFNYIMN